MSAPIFDSHGGLPPGDARDLDRRIDAYAEAAAAAGFCGGCVLALPGRDEEADFITAVGARPGLVPIPAWPRETPDPAPPEAVLDRFLARGAKGFHIHPRAAALSPADPRFARILRGAAERDLVVFHCTYAFASVVAPPPWPGAARLPIDPLPHLAAALADLPTLRCVLLHGGGVELLRYSEFVRANPHLLLDLSLTLMKYPGSSLDLDLAFMFAAFDRRICLGTDWPDYSPAATAARFEGFTAALPPEKRRNAASGNLRRLLRLEE